MAYMAGHNNYCPINQPAMRRASIATAFAPRVCTLVPFIFTALELKNLVHELTPASKRYALLATELGMPSHQLDAIEHDYSKRGRDGILIGVVDWWLNNDSNPSWTKMAECVKAIGEPGIAKKMIDQYCSPKPHS